MCLCTETDEILTDFLQIAVLVVVVQTSDGRPRSQRKHFCPLLSGSAGPDRGKYRAPSSAIVLDPRTVRRVLLSVKQRYTATQCPKRTDCPLLPSPNASDPRIFFRSPCATFTPTKIPPPPPESDPKLPFSTQFSRLRISHTTLVLGVAHTHPYQTTCCC